MRSPKHHPLDRSLPFRVVVIGVIMAACSPDDTTASGVDSGAETSDASVVDGVGVDAAAACTPITNLGTYATGEDGVSKSITFQLPSDARSFTVVVTGPPDTFFNIAHLALADELTLVPPSWISLAGQPVACVDACPNRVVAQPGAAAFLFPNTPLVKLRPGEVKLRIKAFKRGSSGDYKNQATEAQVSVVMACGSTPLKSRKIGLNVGFTGAGGLSSDVGLEDARIAKALKIVTKIYAEAGIELAPIRALAAPTETIVTKQWGEESALTKLFGGTADWPQGLNVLLVDKIYSAQSTGPGESLLAGVAGGIPAPPLMPGTARSGIAVALHLASGQEDALGYVIAHELAHYLGLFHTVEVGASIADNIPDTDDSPTNLLHPNPSQKSVELTPQQRAVIYNSAWFGW